MQNILTRLPPGFRFCPADEELISYYLPRKVHGRLAPEEADVIKDCSLYGREEPWEIFKKFTGHKEGDDVLYFFTTLDKKTPNSTKRMSRTVGTNGGTWHGGSTDEVKYWLDNREFKGTRKRFRYQNKQRPDQHGCWTLLEYGSESISENDVICKLKISDRGLKKSRQRKSIASSKVIQRNINIDAVINSGPTTAQSATGDTFYSIHNIGPMTVAGDNAVTPEAAAPAVSAIPVMDADLIETLKNEPNWYENFQAMLDYQI